jgi:hypothetical protein
VPVHIFRLGGTRDQLLSWCMTCVWHLVLVIRVRLMPDLLR